LFPGVNIGGISFAMVAINGFYNQWITVPGYGIF